MSDVREEVARLQAELARVQAQHEATQAENARLLHELEQRNAQLSEALDQQTATAEVLKIISRSAFDLQSVLATLIENAVQLSRAEQGIMFQTDGEAFSWLADFGVSAEFRAFLQSNPLPAGRGSAVGRVVLERRTIHIVDTLADPEYSMLSHRRIGDFRTMLAVPMLRGENLLGVFGLYRREVQAFTVEEIAIVETFADQAVIAIENVRLFQDLEQRTTELTDALEQQTALGEVLSIIAASPSDPTRVLDAIASAAGRFTESDNAMVQHVEGDLLVPVGRYGISAEAAAQGHLRIHDTPITLGTMSGRTFLEGRTIHTPDVPAATESEFPDSRLPHLRMRQRSQVATPLVREGKPIGVLVVQRQQQQAFTEREIALLEAFADQAVIAIENARLFQALEQRTTELTDALEQQTAQAEVLRVIAASPTDLETVLQTIVETACRLSRSAFSAIRLIDGDSYYTVAFAGDVPADVPLRHRRMRRLISERSSPSETLRTGKTVHVEDVCSDESVARYPDNQQGPQRTTLNVPLIREGQVVGALTHLRTHVQPFIPAEIALAETFADQAAIAIENARLFSELEQRTAQLTEALEQQTATADILRVIASSPGELQQVLDAVTERAAKVCGAADAHIRIVDGDYYVRATGSGTDVTNLQPRQLIDRNTPSGRIILDRKPLLIEDMMAASSSEYAGLAAEYQKTGFRSALGVPMLRHGVALGTIIVRRFEVRPFTDREVRLLEAFADQAVIAIENARLFHELERRTADLTRSVAELHALGEVGQAVSSSLDLPTVLTTIVANAARLAEADGGIVYEYDDAAGVFELRAADQLPDDLAATLRNARLRQGEGVVGRAALSRAPLQVHDVEASDLLTPEIRTQLLAAGLRSVLAVPLLREGRVLGGLVLSRRTPGAFPDEVVLLLQTLATQSALAIHNARLYQTLEVQGQALAEASQHKSQFLANMSHELRTPLNAVIGYSEMLQEELEELDQAALVPDVEKINTAGRHLLGLINDILDLSKIEAGKMDLFLEPVEVEALVRDVAATVAPLIARNGNQLQVEVARDIGTMHADGTKLRQILFNLLGNAAKFTERGTITLSVSHESADWLAFAVSDTGIGMTDAQIGRLFQAFSQAEASTTRRFGGTGLGLTLVRHFAEMMGGEVHVRSAEQAGSTFTVRLPAVVTTPAPLTNDSSAPAADDAATMLAGSGLGADAPLVLVIDDDQTARELLRRHLEADGLRVVEAAGGEEGLRLARQLRPALVTLDVLMPGVDGWAVLGALKGDPTTAEIPVILLTILDDRDLGYALGAADYLTKPIDRDRLFRAVCKHVRPGSLTGGRRALIVEDDAATREMLRRLLQREGWAVHEAANGRLGLEQVAASQPDLILLDLMMPELDGFGFVERLRAVPAWRTIPVLVITAKDLTPQERLRLNGWVEQVLQKGAYTRSELLAEVRSLVRASVERLKQ